MTVTFEQILVEAEQLSPAEQMRLVVHLVSHMQTLALQIPYDVVVSSHTPARKALIDAVCGKYAHLPNSSDDFARRKQEEIAIEEHHNEL